MLEAPAYREGAVGLVSNTSPSLSIVGDDLGNRLFGWKMNNAEFWRNSALADRRISFSTLKGISTDYSNLSSTKYFYTTSVCFRSDLPVNPNDGILIGESPVKMN